MTSSDPQRMHGFYHIELRERWIRVTVAEGVNLELVKKYQSEAQAAMESFQGAQWGMHLLVVGDALLTPDATQKLQAMICSRARMGCCAVAIQLIEAQAPSLVRAYWGELYRHSGMPYCFCDDEQQAEQWLATELNTYLQKIE
jgi:hypothetical protein